MIAKVTDDVADIHNECQLLQPEHLGGGSKGLEGEQRRLKWQRENNALTKALQTKEQ
jgi:hypothetical protein